MVKGLHDWLDELLEELPYGFDIDLYTFFQNRYYGTITYAFFSELINHLIKEKYLGINPDNDCVFVTDEGASFIKTGGYKHKFDATINKIIQEHEIYGKPKKLELKTYLDIMNFPDKSEEYKANRRRLLWSTFLMFLTLIVIHLLLKK